jgi:hypothetical protein
MTEEEKKEAERKRNRYLQRKRSYDYNSGSDGRPRVDSDKYETSTCRRRRLLPVVSETSVDDLVDEGVRPDHSDLRVKGFLRTQAAGIDANEFVGCPGGSSDLVFLRHVDEVGPGLRSPSCLLNRSVSMKQGRPRAEWQQHRSLSCVLGGSPTYFT